LIFKPAASLWQKLTQFLGHILVHHAVLTLLLGVITTLWGSYYTVKIYKNLRSDIAELLPTSSRSVQDLDEVTERLNSVDSLGVIALCPDGEASRKWVDAVAKELSLAPPESNIAAVEHRINREIEFFNKRKSLYIDVQDLERIRDYIRDRITYEKKLYNPLTIFSEVEIPEPHLDFGALESKYTGRAGAYSRFKDGYFANEDGTQRAMLVYLNGRTSEISRIHSLKKTVQAAIDKFPPQSFHPQLEVRFAGGVQSAIEEQESLLGDLGFSSVLVGLIVSASIYFYFKSFRSMLALVLSLFAGVFWTFGISYFAVGYLNANSAFLGSIIIGNGINFGIIFLARYLEERRAGQLHEPAIIRTIRGTATATLTAALAAGLSYGSLILTQFRGFNQFGLIGFMGMVLCWLSAYTVLPALLTLFERKKPIIYGRRALPPRAIFATWVANGISRFPLLIWVISFGATLASIAVLPRYSSELIESDLRKLRSKVSMERGAGFNAQYLNDIFDRYLSPVVLLPRSRGSAEKIATELQKIQTEEGNQTLLRRVQRIDDFIPQDQEKKIAILKQIRDILPAKIIKRLSLEDQARVKVFLSPEAMKPLHEQDLPEMILRKFTEKSGERGRLLVIEPPLKQEILNRANLKRFVETLRNSVDEVEKGAPVAGSQPIVHDLIESIESDGPKTALVAFLAVVALVVFLFRNPGSVALCLFSLTLGVLWMVGIILGFGMKINFLNFIALPITFGIGIDYGVNIFQRFREEGGSSILRVIRETGGAVTLCSFTTMVGYGSLLLAENQAFVSFGLISVIGELTCVFAAVFSLPAFMLLRARKKSPLL